MKDLKEASLDFEIELNYDIYKFFFFQIYMSYRIMNFFNFIPIYLHKSYVLEYEVYVFFIHFIILLRMKLINNLSELSLLSKHFIRDKKI